MKAGTERNLAAPSAAAGSSDAAGAADAPRVPFIIAEAGVNHNGDAKLAEALIDAAAEACADAVKFQTFRADQLATATAPKARYQETATAAADGQLAMLRKLELKPKSYRALVERCRKRGIEFLSTPFDEASADFLDGLGMRRFKIPSGEITNFPLLGHIARKGKPVLLSTGMSTLVEVGSAVAAIKAEGDPPLTLLHCVSSYPAEPKDVNLRAMATMAEAFGKPVGYSDHTSGLEVAVAAAALGAVVIEKHFTLDKSLSGPDHRMSLDPAELKALVAAVRNAALALGDGAKAPRPCEEETRRVARRSIVLAKGGRAGAAITVDMIALKRPGTGIPPARLEEILGRKLQRDVPPDTLLEWGMLG